MIEHHGARQDQGRRIGHALPRDVRSTAVDRLEDGRIGADVGAWGQSQAAHQSRCQVGQDVTEHVGGHDHVELLGPQHHLHRGVVDDEIVPVDLPLELAGDVPSYLEEQAAHHLQDVGLVDDAHLVAALRHGVLEGKTNDALAPLARHDGRRLGHGPGVAAHTDEVLHPDVQALEVLAHQHQVDAFEAAAGHHGVRGTHVGVQTELPAQRHVDRPEPGPHRSG